MIKDTILRVIFSAYLVATKMASDVYFANAAFVRRTPWSLEEINSMEVEILVHIEYKSYIPPCLSVFLNTEFDLLPLVLTGSVGFVVFCVGLRCSGSVGKQRSADIGKRTGALKLCLMDNDNRPSCLCIFSQHWYVFLFGFQLVAENRGLISAS